jgi:hypothetical protein
MRLGCCTAINLAGEIIDHELHSPFAYLRSLVDEFSTENTEECGSEQPLGGALSTCLYNKLVAILLDGSNSLL